MIKKEYQPLLGEWRTFEIPENCNHPILIAAADCKAPHHTNPECDCRWCVYNKEFNQAKEARNSHVKDEEA